MKIGGKKTCDRNKKVKEIPRTLTTCAVDARPSLELMRLPFALAALAVKLHGAAATGLQRELQQGSCLGRRNFQIVVDGDCSLDSIVEALEPRIERIKWCKHSAEEELMMILGTWSHDEASRKIENMCLDAVEEKIRSSVDFGFITQMDDAYNKEFFDGRTYWNEGGDKLRKKPKPDVPGVFRGNAKRVDTIDRKVATKRVIQWPDHLANFQNCELNSAMCCWSNVGMAQPPPGGKSNNTDVCLVDLSKSSTSNHMDGGFTIFEGAEEGDVYCHGMAWENNPAGWNHWFKGNVLFDMSLREMRHQGHTRNIAGSPMCGCIEQMPVVTRADCTEAKVDSRILLKFTKGNNKLSAKLLGFQLHFDECEGAEPHMRNDLSSFYEKLWLEGQVDEVQKEEFERIIVGENQCSNAIDDFLLDMYGDDHLFHCPDDGYKCPDGTILRRDPHLSCEFPECPAPPDASGKVIDASSCGDGMLTDRMVLHDDIECATLNIVGDDSDPCEFSGLCLGEGAVLDCNGHSIGRESLGSSGEGIAAGVRMSSDSKLIDCNIVGFEQEGDFSVGVLSHFNSTGVVVEDTTVTGNSLGIYASYGSSVTLNNVKAYGNEVGILVSPEFDQLLATNSAASNNVYAGIILGGGLFDEGDVFADTISSEMLDFDNVEACNNNDADVHLMVNGEVEASLELTCGSCYHWNEEDLSSDYACPFTCTPCADQNLQASLSKGFVGQELEQQLLSLLEKVSEGPFNP